MMLKKAWSEVTEKTTRNCSRKSVISLKTQEGAGHDHDDSAVHDLVFDLNQRQKARSDLAPENLDADELEIVNE